MSSDYWVFVLTRSEDNFYPSQIVPEVQDVVIFQTEEAANAHYRQFVIREFFRMLNTDYLCSYNFFKTNETSVIPIVGRNN